VNPTWHVAEWCSFRGVGHTAGWVRGVSDVGVVHGLRQLGTWPGRAPQGAVAAPGDAVAFALSFRLPSEATMDAVALIATDPDGERHRLDDPLSVGLADDPYHRLWPRFRELLAADAPGRLLQVGARGERTEQLLAELPTGWTHVGLDIRPGPNVDVVEDAHALRRVLGRRERFDAVVAFSVFEHLAMPWKVVLELNAVLRDGGLVLVETHQTFPLHEVPWDYWRYSNDTWFALFNPATGFVVEEVAMGEPAAIVPRFSHAIVADNEHGQAFLGAGVIARRIGRTRLRWDVTLDDVIANSYPS